VKLVRSWQASIDSANSSWFTRLMGVRGGDAMKLWTFVAGTALALAALGPASAQDGLVIINDPASPQVNGARARLLDDPVVQGGKALRVPVRRKGSNPWDVSVQTTIIQPVKAGDALVLAFWARLEAGEGGATTATLPSNAVQQSSAPYEWLFGSPVEIGPEWKLHEIRGKAGKDYAAGTLNATIHLATAQQTVDFGPIFVINLGSE
jgi:hypothetical protein